MAKYKTGLPRINGRTCRAWVQERSPFKNSNGQLYAEWVGLDGIENTDARYVVYSYGTHWPLFAYVPKVGLWFENTARKSPTTSKHRTYAHPCCDTVKLGLEDIFVLARDGYSDMVMARLLHGETMGGVKANG